jgi:hypothetical protein
MTTEQQTSTAESTPAPEIPEAVAESRALDAETEYIRKQLENASCLDEWGIGTYTAEAYGRVQTVTDRGYVVDVQRPFSWEHEGSIVDGVAQARYVVNENETVQLEAGSIDSPC